MLSQQRSSKRRFQHQWLESYKGLVYSPSLDACFCQYCFLFEANKSGRGHLTTDGFRLWTKASEHFKKHFLEPEASHGKKQGQFKKHMECVSKGEAFRAMMENRQKSVENMFEREKEETIEKNPGWTQIYSAYNHILWTAQPATSWSSWWLAWETCTIESWAKSWELSCINRVQNRSWWLEAQTKHWECSKVYCTYLSKTTQNQLINILGDVIRDEILGEIRKFIYFSISADEAADCSNKEQLSLTIWFVHSSDKVREEFIEFDHCKEGTTGEALAELIKGRLQALGLQLENIRGQCYDGAGAMRGKDKGVGPRIQREYPKAVPVWCSSHTLNLVVVSGLKLLPVDNMMCIYEDEANHLQLPTLPWKWFKVAKKIK